MKSKIFLKHGDGMLKNFSFSATLMGQIMPWKIILQPNIIGCHEINNGPIFRKSHQNDNVKPVNADQFGLN